MLVNQRTRVFTKKINKKTGNSTFSVFYPFVDMPTRRRELGSIYLSYDKFDIASLAVGFDMM